MFLVFVEVEDFGTEVYTAAFPGHEVALACTLEDVPKNAELISLFTPAYIEESFLEKHPRLKFIVLRAAFLNAIDLPACQAAAIRLVTIEDHAECALAEYTFALLLAVAHRLPDAVKAHSKEFFSYQDIQGVELWRKTLGLAGNGRVIQRLVRIAKALEMEVLVHDPTLLKQDLPLYGSATLVSKRQLLKNADFISLHLPLTPRTYHFLDELAFGDCRPGVIIINTANGGLIETEALFSALERRIVAGVGLDSLEEERMLRQEAVGVIADQIIEKLRAAPEPGEQNRKPMRILELQRLTRNQMLLGRPEVIFTPQTAFNSQEAIHRSQEAKIEAIRACLCA